MTLGLRFAARSDRGLVRQNNEDSVYAGPRLLALADGMGGHAGGEVASRLIVAALAPLDADEPGTDLTGKLRRAMEFGNATIAEEAAENHELEGMGTTLTALLFTGRRVAMIHVGDSRAYLLRDNELHQITRDDTYVQSLVDEGTITPDEAHNHPRRSLILKALTGEPVEPTTTVREIREGDRYLICSDGLSDPVSDETIGETLKSGSPAEAAERLVSLALRSGGPDNVTVVVADATSSDFADVDTPQVAGAASALGDEDASASLDTAAGRAAALRPRAEPLKIEPATTDASTKGRGKWRFALSALGAIVLLAAVGAISVVLIRSNYYVGERDNQVVVLRGVAGELFGVRLSNVAEVGCLSRAGELTLHEPDSLPKRCEVFTLNDLRSPARAQVEGGMPAGKRVDARENIQRLAADQLLPLCEELTTSTTVPTRGSKPSVTAGPTESASSSSAVPTDATAGPETTTASPARVSGSPETPAPTAAVRTPVPGENCRAVS